MSDTTNPGGTRAVTALSVLLVVGVPCAAVVFASEHVVVAVAVGFLGAVFLNLGRFIRFKAMGIEAELRQAVQDAHATVRQMRDLARPLIRTALFILTKGNRAGSLGRQAKHEMRSDLECAAKSLDIWDGDVEAASDEFFHWHAWDHLLALSYKAGSAPSKEARDALAAQVEKGRSVLPTVEELMAAVGDEITSRADLLQVIGDYEHYLKTKMDRRNDSDYG